MRRVCLALIVITTQACERPTITPATFVAAFPEQLRIELEEDPGDPIVEISALTIAPDGRMIVTDQPASKIRIFAPSGSLLQTLGREGEGPGELQAPAWAAAGPEGEIRVVERGSPRLTVFWPNDSVSLLEIPGHYGSWISYSHGRWFVGAATRTTRFAALSADPAEPAVPFGSLPEEVNTTPFWIFFAKDRAVALDESVWVNNSFSPDLRIFDARGIHSATTGSPPGDWVSPTAPPIDALDQPGDQARIEEWAQTFTVVANLAARGDSLVAVQYGSHRPHPREPYAVEPRSADVYGRDGRKLFEGLTMDARLLSGGPRFVVLADGPPGAWTLAFH